MTTPTTPKPAADTAGHHRYLADDDEFERYSPIGLDGLLAATEKLLAVNRGLADPDDRDSLPNDRIYTVDRLMAERVKLDHNKSLRTLMGRLGRTRSLTPMGPGAFNGYTLGYMDGNPLAPALEEINPMHIVEQQRRVTKMGPGGIGDPNAITADMQCHSDDTEVFTRTGWKFWPDVVPSDELACRIDGCMEFHTPSALHAATYSGVMFGKRRHRHGGADYLVTPTHRFWSVADGRTKNRKWETASEQFGKGRAYPASSGPYTGSDSRDQFTLEPPHIIKNGKHAHTLPAIDMGDWCEFLGWYCAEGSIAPDVEAKKRHYSVVISQLEDANPDKVAAISALLGRMPFGSAYQNGKNFMMSSKALHAFLRVWGSRCWSKRVPDFLFEVLPQYRRRFLDAYALGDGWQQNSGSWVYTTTSPAMAVDLERLIISMGRPSSCGTPWMGKRRNGEPSRLAYRVNELTSEVAGIKPTDHLRTDYCGVVYCATVPGSLLLTRRGHGSKPLWTGNSVSASQFGFIDPVAGPESERAGIDVRLAWGTKIGSDGRVYQQLRNRSTGEMEWVSPTQLMGKTLKLPD